MNHTKKLVYYTQVTASTADKNNNQLKQYRAFMQSQGNTKLKFYIAEYFISTKRKLEINEQSNLYRTDKLRYKHRETKNN